MAVNTAAGGASSEQLVYAGSKDGVLGAAITSGITAGGGYLAGSKIGDMEISGDRQYLRPVVWGNVIGADVSEFMKWNVSKIDEARQKGAEKHG